MFPRSFRVLLLISLLFSVIIIGVPFGRSSAAGHKGTARAPRFGQDSKTINPGTRQGGPPNYDAFGASKKRAAAAAAMTQTAIAPQSQAGHVVQMEPRLGVPTFLWAPEKVGGQGKQISANRIQAKVDIESTARAYLGDYGPSYRLTSSDVAAARLTAVHDTGRGAIIAKFRQDVGGVEVFRDEINVIMNRELQLVALSGYLTGDDTSMTLSSQDFTLQPAEALAKALQDLTGTPLNSSALRSVKSGAGEAITADDKSQNPYLLFTADKSAAGNFAFADEPSRVKQVLYHTVDGYIPAYYVETEILVPSTEVVTLSGEPVMTDWAYAYVISAVDGQVLFRNNLIEDIGGTPYTYRVWADPATKIPYDTPAGNDPHPKLTPLPDAAQALFVSPNDVSLANYPFSRNDPWLAPGATETVGNNVDAFANLFNPDGYGPVAAPADPATGDFRAQITGPDAFLHTHAPGSSTLTTAEARQGAVQQLFYDLNFLHDWFYDAGFDEAAGNAQTDNYGRGGLGNDSIKAQAEDVAGRNNANMFTPADGNRPRMRMYVFDNAAVKYLDVQSPVAAAGQRAVGTATFGPQSFDVTNQIVYAQPTNGCTALTNAAAVAGKFVMIDMSGGVGSCSVGTKINNGMNAGAAGYILVNSSTQPNNVINVSGSLPSFTIPFLSISWNSAASIKTQLGAAQTVTARMRRDAGTDRDGAVDNQIVFHEWGHYISNRLIGNANGLNTNQAGGLGEGWGDFHAMLLTVRPDDINTPSNANWNGAYALATYATSGSGNDGYYGIRRYPYSTDLTKNPLTFKHIQDGVALPVGPPVSFGADGSNNSEVHNTGEVWATMLWECYASLLRDSGRLSFQEAQERMKYYLVAAYKMTPVDPTLLEARDALLVAAYAYDRADWQLFLQAFAKRGAGIGAVAPDRYSFDNSGVVESFSAGASLSYLGAWLGDHVQSCDNDGYLDNNEQGRLSVVLINTGTEQLSNTTATVSSSNPGVTFPNGATVNLPASQPGQIITASVVVAGTNLSGVQGADFTITVQDPSLGGDVTVHHLAHLNVDEVPAASATDDVEARKTVWTVGGTSTTVVTGSEPLLTQSATAKWRRVATSENNNVWSVSDVGTGADQYLVSPVVTVDGGGSFNMQFDHSFGFEFDGGGNYDGGVIETSVNGGAWTDMGSSAYNGTILNYGGSTNPLKGRAAFVQNSGGTAHVSLTQAVAPGSTIQVRFRIGSDASGGSSGWQVDNIAFGGIVETPFTQTVADAANCHAAAPAPSWITLTPGVMPSGVKDVAYPTTLLTPSGGTAPYTYSVTPFALPTGLSYDVVNGNLQISGTPTRLGNFPVAILITDSLGNQGWAGYMISINKPTPTLTWNNPADITYGTALGGAQLNATASVPGTFTYTPAAGTVLGAGAGHTLTVTFTPTDTTTYSSASKTVQINVLKATPTITWSNPADINYGAALTGSQLNATASIPGTFIYNPASGTVLGVGNNQTLSASFTPTDAVNYNPAAKNVSVNVLKAGQTITFGPLSDKTYGDAAFALGATASSGLPVSFQIISGPATVSGDTLTITGAGTVTVRASQPGDASYNAATSVDRTLTVNKAVATITWANPSDMTYGTALGSAQLNATASIPGTLTYTPAAGTILNAGSNQTLSVNFTPTDGNNYQTASKSVSVNVLKADQTITFNALADRTFGEAPFALGATASSGLPMSFQVVSGPATLSGNTLTISGAGPVTIRASQGGTINYNAAPSIDRTFNVSAASASVTLSNTAAVYDGTARSVTATTNPAGLNVTISYSQNGVVITPINAGSYDVTATINDANYQGAAAGTLVIGKTTPVITWNDPPHITSSDTLSGAQLNATANVPGAFLYNPPAGTLLGVGSHQLSVTLTPTDSGNYEAATASVQLVVDESPAPTFNFSSAAYSASEGGGSVEIVVNRGGDLSGPATVNYSTSDSAGLTNCNVENGVGSSRCDYATTVGTLRFAAGESSKTISIPVVDDAFAEGVENFTITLTGATGASLGATSAATITIADNDSSTGATNPLDDTAFFVRQHYIDFLGREPDPVGYPAWQAILNTCAPGDTACDRVEVSSAFFRSEEFRSRGYFVYRFYSLLGRTPHYSEFMPDLGWVSGFLDPAQLEANKVAFVAEFMTRQEFQDKYGSLTAPAAYVDALLQTVGQPNHPARETWINALATGTMTRAEVLRALAESQEVGAKYYNEAFVVMQYFGYLRRDPDILYLQWVSTMNQNGGDYRAMISGFLNSAEYRQRFGQ